MFNSSIEMCKQLFVALCSVWKDLAACKILLRAVAVICSECWEISKSLKLEECEQFFETIGFRPKQYKRFILPAKASPSNAQEQSQKLRPKCSLHKGFSRRGSWEAAECSWGCHAARFSILTLNHLLHMYLSCDCNPK